MSTRLRLLWAELNRLAQFQVGLVLAAVVTTLLSSIFLAGSVIVEHEACYGVQGGKNPCTPFDAAAALRLIVVLAVVLGLYVGAALLTVAQHRARDPFARSTAFMFLVTIALLILGMTLSALGGPGFYLLPSLVLLVASVILGLAIQVLGSRLPSSAAPSTESQRAPRE